LGLLVPIGAGAVSEDIPKGQIEAEAAAAHELAEACARSACRTESRELRLKSSAGGEWGIKTQLFPYTDKGQILLYAGETIEVEFAADGKAMDKPRFLRVVAPGGGQNDPVPSPDPNVTATMTLELKQMENKPDMTLIIRSTLGFMIKYDAYMFVPTKDGMRSIYTSSCPIIPRGSAYETWPQEIAMLALTDFRVVSERDAGSCN